MRVIAEIPNHDYTITMIVECEQCKARKIISTGNVDTFRKMVLPTIKCSLCGKKKGEKE